MKISRLKKSILDASHGVKYVFKHEQNFRIQIIAAVVVVVLMLLLEISRAEMVALLLLIMIVLILEILNSAMEKYVDLMKPRLGYHVGVVKDIMAAMVLVSSLGAFVIGTIIFWPYLWGFFYSLSN